MLEVAQMATQHSPHTPASHRGLGHTRIPSIRKPSLSSPASTSVSSNSSTGIPSFRSIRSLLPFGPNKHATTVSASVSPAGSNGSSSRSPFPLFGSARRSMTRERQASLSSLSPVIAIEKPREEEPQIRRSFSLTALEKPLPDEPHLFSVSGDDFDESTEARGKVDLLSSAWALSYFVPQPLLSLHHHQGRHSSLISRLSLRQILPVYPNISPRHLVHHPLHHLPTIPTFCILHLFPALQSLKTQSLMEIPRMITLLWTFQRPD